MLYNYHKFQQIYLSHLVRPMLFYFLETTSLSPSEAVDVIAFKSYPPKAVVLSETKKKVTFKKYKFYLGFIGTFGILKKARS